MGMHQLSLPDSGTASPIGSCVDATDMIERTWIFWNIYSLDKLWSLAANKPSHILDGTDAQTRITTPWPEFDGFLVPVFITLLITRFFANLRAGWEYRLGCLTN